MNSNTNVFVIIELFTEIVYVSRRYLSIYIHLSIYQHLFTPFVFNQCVSLKASEMLIIIIMLISSICLILDFISTNYNIVLILMCLISAGGRFIEINTFAGVSDQKRLRTTGVCTVDACYSTRSQAKTNVL